VNQWYRFNIYKLENNLIALPYRSGRGSENSFWKLDKNGNYESDLGFKNNSMVAQCGRTIFGVSSRGGLYKLENIWKKIHNEVAEKINNIYCISESSFVAALGNELYIFDINGVTVEKIQSKAYPNFLGLISLGGFQIFNVLNKNYLIYSDNSFNSYLYDFESKDEQVIFKTDENVEGVSGQNIITFYKGEFYLSSGNRFFYKNTLLDEWNEIKTPDSTLIRSINIDKNGGVFIATDKGIYKKSENGWNLIWEDSLKKTGYGLLGRGVISGDYIIYPLNRTNDSDYIYAIMLNTIDLKIKNKYRSDLSKQK